MRPVLQPGDISLGMDLLDKGILHLKDKDVKKIGGFKEFMKQVFYTDSIPQGLTVENVGKILGKIVGGGASSSSGSTSSSSSPSRSSSSLRSEISGGFGSGKTNRRGGRREEERSTPKDKQGNQPSPQPKTRRDSSDLPKRLYWDSNSIRVPPAKTVGGKGNLPISVLMEKEIEASVAGGMSGDSKDVVRYIRHHPRTIFRMLKNLERSLPRESKVSYFKTGGSFCTSRPRNVLENFSRRMEESIELDENWFDSIVRDIG